MALGRTVEDLEVNLSYRELTEWIAYYELEPWGEERADLRMGIETSSLVRLWADPKKAKAITPAMFMPYYEPPPKRQKTPAEILAVFDALTNR